MTKRILVPLDRSAASEDVLPVVADIARSAGSTVRWLNVQAELEPAVAGFDHVVAYADQEMARLRADGEIYLEGAETVSRRTSVPVLLYRSSSRGRRAGGRAR